MAKTKTMTPEERAEWEAENSLIQNPGAWLRQHLIDKLAAEEEERRWAEERRDRWRRRLAWLRLRAERRGAKGEGGGGAGERGAGGGRRRAWLRLPGAWRAAAPPRAARASARAWGGGRPDPPAPPRRCGRGRARSRGRRCSRR